MATAALNIYSNRLTPILHLSRIVKTGRLARLTENRRLVNAVYWAAVATVTLAVGVLVLLHGVFLLKSSGVIPSSGAISGLSTFISSLMNSVKWFAATLVGLSAVVICAMFIGGHQSAHSHGMRVGFSVIGLMCLGGLVS